MAKDYAKDFYESKAWKDCRTAYRLSKNDLCERCKDNGTLTPCKIVHHKVYITPDNINNPNITLSWDNLECLCQDCHNKEHHKNESTTDNTMFDDNGQLVPR